MILVAHLLRDLRAELSVGVGAVVEMARRRSTGPRAAAHALHGHRRVCQSPKREDARLVQCANSEHGRLVGAARRHSEPAAARKARGAAHAFR